jgi:hypothetical protein
VHGELGVRPERADPGVHRWISASLPATLTLEWDAPTTVREIRLVFDTGLHRELTLSMCNAVARRLLWGQPQPETVKNYRMEALINGQWRTVAEEKNNFLRHRIHRLPEPVWAAALRVTVESTNGMEHARVCEMRVYS